MRPSPAQDPLGRFVRGDGTPAPAPAPDAPKRRRGAQQFKHFKVDAVLTDEQRADYERLLARPTTTVADLRAFLRACGHRVCRSAVSRHRRSWNADLKRLREVARMAASFCELSRTHGAGAVAEASHARFEMMLMESLFQLPGARQIPPAEWQQMSRTLQGVIATRRTVEAMRAEYDAKAKAAAAAAERAAGQGASGPEVVARMKEILGV